MLKHPVSSKGVLLRALSFLGPESSISRNIFSERIFFIFRARNISLLKVPFPETEKLYWRQYKKVPFPEIFFRMCFFFKLGLKKALGSYFCKHFIVDVLNMPPVLNIPGFWIYLFQNKRKFSYLKTRKAFFFW